MYMYAYYCISDPKIWGGGGTQARGGKSQGSPLLYATLFGRNTYSLAS